jgi:hypothetical protein
LVTILSRRGGKAPQRDPLQKLIEEIVCQDPKISQPQLWHRLRKEIGNGTIVSIDPEGPARKIHFVASDGKVKTAAVSGLKDRLSRAKQK